MRETIGSPQGQARWRPPDVASDDGVKTEALPSPTEIDLEQGVEELLARVQPRPAGALARSPSAEISRGLRAAVKSKSAEAAAAAVGYSPPRSAEPCDQESSRRAPCVSPRRPSRANWARARASCARLLARRQLLKQWLLSSLPPPGARVPLAPVRLHVLALR